MGMDYMEVVMDVEEHFGIVIADEEMKPIRTVADLVALIRSRVDGAVLSPCPSLAAFLSLRRLIRDVVGNDRLRLRPSRTVVEELSRAQRKKLWARLPEVLGTPPRPLRYPRPIRWGLFVLFLLSIAVAIGIASIDWVMLPLTLLLALGLTVLLLSTTSPLRNVPADNMATLGDITRMIAGRTSITADLDLPNGSAILDELRPIFAEILGIDTAKVVPSARLVEDLGMG